MKGKPVQEYDIDHSRLDYMERSGSGLSKIRDVQMISANYVPDRLQFVITIPNLNYENEMIKSILAENYGDQVGVQDRVQVRDQVRVQVVGQDMGQVIGQVTWRDLAEYCKLPRTRAEMQNFAGYPA